MKLNILLGLFIWSLFNSVQAFDKSLYGVDHRRLIGPQSNEQEWRISKSILAQVSLSRLEKSINSVEYSIFNYQSLEVELNYCPDEKFSKLPFFSDCSGFLVGENLLLTAGHCINDINDCKSKVWIADYLKNSEIYLNQNQLKIENSSIFECTEIIDRQYDFNNKVDFALIKLNKKAKDRGFLKLRKNGSLKNNARLAVFGYPLGLPQIIADQVKTISSGDANFFLVNSDTFSGSSGSPVIDLNTELVEGILIRGAADFSYDIDNNCNRPLHCDSNNCNGEMVLKSRTLPLKKLP